MPETFTLNVEIRPAIDALTRSSRFEEPIDQELRSANLGKWVGGGSWLDGSASDISFEVTDLKRGLAAVCLILQKNGAPRSTRIIQLRDPNVIHQLYE
jgi:hypothetical protein